MRSARDVSVDLDRASSVRRAVAGRPRRRICTAGSSTNTWRDDLRRGIADATRRCDRGTSALLRIAGIQEGLRQVARRRCGTTSRRDMTKRASRRERSRPRAAHHTRVHRERPVVHGDRRARLLAITNPHGFPALMAWRRQRPQQLADRFRRTTTSAHMAGGSSCSTSSSTCASVASAVGSLRSRADGRSGA